MPERAVTHLVGDTYYRLRGSGIIPPEGPGGGSCEKPFFSFFSPVHGRPLLCSLSSYAAILTPENGSRTFYLCTPNLINYHGTAAINVTRYLTWDAVLLDMMDQSNAQIIVSVKRCGRGHADGR